MMRAYNQIMDRIGDERLSLLSDLSRYALWSPIFLGLGIALYFTRAKEPESLAFSLVWALFFLLMALFSYLKRDVMRRGRYSYLFFFYCFLIAGGFFVADWRVERIQSPQLDGEAFNVSLEATVHNISKTDSGYRLYLKDIKTDDTRIDHLSAVRITKRGQDKPDFKAGDRVQMRANLMGPSPPFYPGGFDFQKHAFFEQIGAYGYNLSLIEVVERGQSNPSFVFENWRGIIENRVSNIIEASDRASIITTFMTGERDAISDTALQAIRDSGLAHLLAISGLHVGFVAGLVFFFVRLCLACIPSLALRWPIKKIAAFTAFMAALFFTIMVGASVPTQRALLMSGLVLFAVMIDRQAISLRLVAIAAFLILLLQPEELLKPSFQLSFAAVTALVCFYEYLRPALKDFYQDAGILKKALGYFLGLIITSFIAGLATAPLTLAYFGHVALYGILANMLALPVMGVIIMPFLILAYLLMPLGLAQWPVMMMDYGIQWLLGVAFYVSSMDGASLDFSIWQADFVYYLMVGLLLIELARAVSLKMAGAILILFSIIVAFQIRAPFLLMSNHLNLIAAKDEAGLYWFYEGREAEKFMKSVWLDAMKQDFSPRWPLEANSYKARFMETPIRCDQSSCIYDYKGLIIAFPRAIQAYEEDCQNADIVIARKHYHCEKAQWYSYRDWRDQGVIAAYHKAFKMDRARAGNIEFITTQSMRAKRPWTGATSLSNNKND